MFKTYFFPFDSFKISSILLGLLNTLVLHPSFPWTSLRVPPLSHWQRSFDHCQLLSSRPPPLRDGQVPLATSRLLLDNPCAFLWSCPLDGLGVQKVVCCLMKTRAFRLPPSLPPKGDRLLAPFWELFFFCVPPGKISRSVKYSQTPDLSLFLLFFFLSLSPCGCCFDLLTSREI